MRNTDGKSAFEAGSKRIGIPTFRRNTSETNDEAKRDRVDILILDNSSGMCAVLARHLSELFKLRCISCAHGDSPILETLARYQPKILILDPAELSLSPQHDLQDFRRSVRIISARTMLFGYTARMDDAILRGVIGAQFVGCVGKQSDLQQLEIGLMAVQSGGMYFDPGYGNLLHEVVAQDSLGSNDLLSKRERAVIILTAKGQPAKQIAQELQISAKTVETYKGRALNKLGLSNRAELLDHALAKGWLA
jgi:DNA-binding NarL/FixJ family response regulator